MSPNLTIIRNGKKFMWDGRLFENPGEASNTAASYMKDGFEVQTLEQEGKLLIYTRRIVRELAVT